MRRAVALLLGLLAGPARADTIPLIGPVLVPMTSAGVQSGSRVYSGVVQTASGGAWSVDLSPMSCSSAPVVVVQALSADTTVANSGVATMSAVSISTASGFVNIPQAGALGGSPFQRGGVGLSVHVIAVCR